jgi:two-component system osmolarity sensor histidine kinase EnvZ
MERIRQPFARLDEARSGRPGAGLGLAIVERIALLHRGTLLLENRAEAGLEATLTIPRL